MDFYLTILNREGGWLRHRGREGRKEKCYITEICTYVFVCRMSGERSKWD